MNIFGIGFNHQWENIKDFFGKEKSINEKQKE
jgi:hypothetical protein